MKLTVREIDGVCVAAGLVGRSYVFLFAFVDCVVYCRVGLAAARACLAS